LVEQRLEKMIVVLVEQGDPARRVSQSAGRGDATKTTTDDNNVRQTGHCCAGQRLKRREPAPECCSDCMVERNRPSSIKQWQSKQRQIKQR
jgi:hypothetical protein